MNQNELVEINSKTYVIVVVFLEILVTNDHQDIQSNFLFLYSSILNFFQYIRNLSNNWGKSSIVSGVNLSITHKL